MTSSNENRILPADPEQINDFDTKTSAVPETIGGPAPNDAGPVRDNPAPAALGVPATALAYAIEMPFDRMVEIRGAAWKQPPKTIEGLAELWKPVVDELLKRLLEKLGASQDPLYPALLAALIGTGVAVSASIAKDKGVIQAKKPAIVRESATESIETERSPASSSSAESASPASPLSWPAVSDNALG